TGTERPRQAGLADAGLAGHHRDATGAGGGVRQQPVEQVQQLVPLQQVCGTGHAGMVRTRAVPIPLPVGFTSRRSRKNSCRNPTYRAGFLLDRRGREIGGVGRSAGSGGTPPQSPPPESSSSSSLSGGDGTSSGQSGSSSGGSGSTSAPGSTMTAESVGSARYTGCCSGIGTGSTTSPR